MFLRALLVAVVETLVAGLVFADTYGSGSESTVSSFLNNVINFVTWTIGPAVFIGGWIIFAYNLMAHDERAWDKAKNVIIGGAALLLARVIWSIISSYAPTH